MKIKILLVVLVVMVLWGCSNKRDINNTDFPQYQIVYNEYRNVYRVQYKDYDYWNDLWIVIEEAKIDDEHYSQTLAEFDTIQEARACIEREKAEDRKQYQEHLEQAKRDTWEVIE